VVIVQRDIVNVFVTCCSGYEGMADGWKGRSHSIAPGGSARRAIDRRNRLIARSMGCDLGRFCFIDFGCVSIVLVLFPRLCTASVQISSGT
jgi:hypothetical protein